MGTLGRHRGVYIHTYEGILWNCGIVVDRLYVFTLHVGLYRTYTKRRTGGVDPAVEEDRRVKVKKKVKKNKRKGKRREREEKNEEN